MRRIWSLALAAGLGLAAGGCGPGKPFDGPTVDAFNGRLVRGGQPVAFPAGEKVQLKLFHAKGESFNIPVNADGTFKIGWMPVGKYSAALVREAAEPGKKGAAPSRYSLPGGLTIEDGKTEYQIELGKDWKPA
ncbi:hypothetical protein J0H58_34975 [bacterium]|nr:hypothetical protein [bacterium]